MTQATTTPSTLTTGIDLGDRKSHVCVLDADGQVYWSSDLHAALKQLPFAMRAHLGHGVSAGNERNGQIRLLS